MKRILFGSGNNYLRLAYMGFKENHMTECVEYDEDGEIRANRRIRFSYSMIPGPPYYSWRDDS